MKRVFRVVVVIASETRPRPAEGSKPSMIGNRGAVLGQLVRWHSATLLRVTKLMVLLGTATCAASTAGSGVAGTASTASSGSTVEGAAPSSVPFNVGAGLAGAWFAKEKVAGRVALIVFGPDGNARKQQYAKGLFYPDSNPPAAYMFDGRTLVVRGGFLGQGCVAESTVHLLSAGQFDIDDTPISGPGCTPGESVAGAGRFTRLSPHSPASDSIWSPAPSSGVPVTDPVQVTGMWRQQGTGNLFAFDDGSGAQYLADENGKIDTAPAHHGTLSITNGGMTASDTTASCSGSTTVDHLTAAGTSPSATIEGTITADPCHLFAGNGQLILRQVK